ncbi:uncharacterized protein LOC132542468 [Erinaceus europaeus]|uniref:Uncharacterized protein LOC132542468 n=1 Tax=Erinaceus europaeus TaxID=9365 RepID=A0ABM3YJ11_ERIEU|nr:uncharacterized protein LOC132542468 [Erinaceus europaeus]
MARKCSQHRGTTMPRSLPPKVTPRKNPDVLLAAGRNLHGSPVPFSGSAPEARLGRVLRKAWPPTRKSLALSVCHPQLDLALALPPGHGPVVLHSPVVLHQGPHTKDRHLFLFRDWLVVAKQRSSEGYRLKQKLHLSDVGVIFCNQEQRQDKDRDHKLIHQGNMLCFTMASSPCLTEFP